MRRPRKSIPPSRCSPSAIRREPVGGEDDHGFERARLLEEMRCARHDLQLLYGRKPGECAPAEIENGGVRATNDEQNRRADPPKSISGKIRPAAARDHGGDVIRRRRGRGDLLSRMASKSV
jgi:hypothetical protein